MTTLHKEGYPTLSVSALILIALNYITNRFLSGITGAVPAILILSVVVFLFLLNFFRNPQRKHNLNDSYVIAPADGKVVAIEEVEETEFFKDKRIQVSIFMSPLNVHVNRSPISGKVAYAKYHPGLFLVAWHPKSSTENERTTLVIKNNRCSVLVRQIAGALARRIVMYPKVDNEVKQCDEFGFIKFGSRVDTLLPVGTKINVKLDEVVKGGITVIAELTS